MLCEILKKVLSLVLQEGSLFNLVMSQILKNLPSNCLAKKRLQLQCLRACEQNNTYLELLC